MKRKIALLLASVMTLSMLPMNLFAASSNHFTKTPMTIPENTLLYEEAFPGLEVEKEISDGQVSYKVNVAEMKNSRTSGSSLYETPGVFSDNTDAEYAIEGTNFVITPTDVIRGGDTFRVKLENADWFFRNTGHANFWEDKDGNGSKRYESGPLKGELQLDEFAYVPVDQEKAFSVPLEKLNVTSPSAFQLKSEISLDSLTSFGGYFNPEDLTSKEKEELSTLDVTTILGTTYNPKWGVWVPSAGDSDVGTYYRTNEDRFPEIRNQDGQIPYKMVISPLDPQVATIVIAGKQGQEVWRGVGTSNYTNDIVIPLVVRATAEDDIKLTVQSSLTSVSSGTYIFGIAGAGSTITKVKDPVTAREEFEIEKLMINETRIGSLESNGSIELKVPHGFSWASTKDAKVFVDAPGVTWGNSKTNEGNRLDDDLNDDGDVDFRAANEDDVMHLLEYGDLTDESIDDLTLSERLKSGEDLGSNRSNFDYALGYAFNETESYTYRNSGTHYHQDSEHYEIDDQTLILTVADLNTSTKVQGALYIEGLTILADESAPMGAFNITVRDLDDDELGVTKQTNVKAGERVDYAVTLKTTSDVPTLVSGRYEEYNSDKFDDYQQAASVKLAETTYNSWWSGRQTVLSLPKEVRFAQMEITEADEIEQEESLEDGVYIYNGFYRNDGKKQGYVTVSENTITFANLKVNDGEKGYIDMDLWLSIAANFEGDIKLTASGSSIPEKEQPSCVIAKAIAPVKIETKISDIKIGYQYQQTADIKITETKAGNLLKGKKFNISVTDLVSTDVNFSPSTQVDVEGDLKIKNISTTGTGSYLLGPSRQSNSISFDIDRESSKASSVLVTKVAVKVDRTVPVSNERPYDVIAWGSAVAQNFDSTAEARKDEFNVPGVSAKYIRVVTSANNTPGVLSSEVRVTIGERSYTVNGKVNEMEAAAYVSPKSNSTMVPLRFVAYAFGLGEDQVIWDSVNRTVTLIHPTRVVQFAIGSQMMLVDGAATTMFSPEGLPVAAEITGERAYVPFRALGNAFGIPVVWEADTSTAVYNKGANDLAQVTEAK